MELLFKYLKLIFLLAQLDRNKTQRTACLTERKIQQQKGRKTAHIVSQQQQRSQRWDNLLKSTSCTSKFRENSYKLRNLGALSLIALISSLLSPASVKAATTTLNFNQTPTLVSGTASQQGAVYRFSNVTTGIDALVTIATISNGTLSNLDDNTSFPNRFQPVINHTGAANTTSYIRFNFQLVASGTTTVISVPNVYFSAQDVDGGGANIIREFVQVIGAQATYIPTPTLLQVMTNPPVVGGVGYEQISAANSQPSIGTDDRYELYSFLGNSVSSFSIIGGNLNGSTGCSGTTCPRQNSWTFDVSDVQRLDFGDAPSTYGNVYHSVPATPTIYLGTTPIVDGDDGPNFSPNADGDDLDKTDDENGVTTFPPLRDTATTYSVTASCTGNNAPVSAWIDFNRNGTFETTERTTGICNNTSVTLNWTGLSGLVLGATYARFRTASTASEIANPTNVASNGEVEDYPLTITPIPGNISGSLYQDANNDNALTVGETRLPADVDVQLLNSAGSVIATVQTNATGDYTFTNVPVATGYQVRVVTTDPQIPTAYVIGTTNPITGINVTAGATVANQNFGFRTPDLTITKTHTGNFSKVGSNTYRLTATNSGTVATNGTVTVSDTVPIGLTPTAATGTGWTCTISGQVVTCTRSDALAANTSYPPITLAVNVAPTAPASITNTATISGGGQTNTTNDSVNDPTTINPLADLSLTKVVNNTSPNVGSNVTFTVTLSNAGPDSATGVSVADLLPAGLTFVSATASQGTYSNTTGVWSVGSVASATNATLQITATVATAGAKTNTAQVTASGQQDPDSTPNNSIATEDDQASATVTPASTDLSIVKTDSPDPAIAGANLTYAIAVTNTGSPATNVLMNDPLPSGTTFQSITSPPGWTCTTPAVGSGGTVSCTATSLAVGTSNFTVVVRVAPNTANNTTLSNTATVSSATSDTNTSNNSSTQNTTIQQSADLRLTKVSTPASPAVGQTFNYTITVTNDGPSIATNVRVRDALPLGIGYVLNTPSQGTYDPLVTQVWNVGTLNPGASATLTIQAIRNSAAATVNTAEVIGADQPDPDSPHNNQVAGEDDQDSVTVPNQAVDLAVTKTVNNATPSVGQNVTFTISVTNPATSTVTATNVGITDALPQGLTYQSHTASTGAYNSNTGVWSIASLTPGTTANLTLVAQVTTSGAKTNTAQLSTLDQSDPNANNDSGSAIVTAAAVPPNLLLVKRITEVAGNPTSGFDDLLAGSKAADDNNANWPTPLATYLRGLLNGGSISPSNEVEYTIYFLNNQNPATNVTICDPIPANMTFVIDGYNSASPRPTEPGASSTDTGIALASNAGALPIAPTVYLTNDDDNDRGRYYPPNDPSTPAACKRVNAAGSVTATGAAANTDGAIVVNVVSGTNQLPAATTAGNPPNSYGFVRFKVRVK